MIFNITYRRWAFLLAGLICFGIGIAFMKRSNLGLGPWAVLSDGIATQTNLQLGTVDIISGVFIFMLWIPLGEKPGVGSIANLILIGLVTNAVLNMLTPATQLIPQLALSIVGILTIGLGSGFYLSTRLGAGPRDGLMMGLVRKTGKSVRLIRTIIEIVVLAAGWLMGGAVGFGTVAFAVGIGPVVQFMFKLLNYQPHPAPDPSRG
jgi:uncharacterized membrane protein YczE